MRILVNAANLRMGGAVQKAVEFIRASVAFPQGHEFHYAVSDVVAGNLRPLVDLDADQVLVAPVSAARPWAGRGTRRALEDLERRFRPDVVFTVFGPAYTTFRSPHLMGFAVGWVSHPNTYAWATLRDPLKRAQFWAWCRHVQFWARFADHWMLESHVAADGLARRLRLPRQRFHVVPNQCGGQYFQARATGAAPHPGMARERASDINVLVFARWYPHKNLELVPQVAAALRERDPTRRYRFFLTFDPSLPPWAGIRSQARRLGVEDRIINLGTVPVVDGPSVYVGADIAFLPTMLETFTATYPEAMCMRTPIVTTDLPFARDVCGEAAAYFLPGDAAGAAEQIAGLAGDGGRRQALIEAGDRRLSAAQSPRELYEQVLEVLAITAQGGRGARRVVGAISDAPAPAGRVDDVGVKEKRA